MILPLLWLGFLLTAVNGQVLVPTAVYNTQTNSSEDFLCVFAYNSSFGIDNCPSDPPQVVAETANDQYFEPGNNGATISWYVRCSLLCYDYNKVAANNPKCTSFIKLKNDNSLDKYGCRVFAGCDPDVDPWQQKTGTNSAGQRTAWVRASQGHTCGAVTFAPTHQPTTPTTDAPTSANPTSSPTTLEPTSEPTTAEPTNEPTTASPTAVPTTLSPTSFPTTTIEQCCVRRN